MFKRLSKRMTILIIVLVIVFGGLVTYNIVRNYMMGNFFAHFEAPAAVVSTVEAKEENWQPVLHSVGSFVAIQGIEINSQVGGIIKTISFESGQYVKQGTPLLVIDDSVEQATLKDAQANLVLQRHNFERQARLLKTGSTSTSDMDAAKASMDRASAIVQQTRNTIAQKHIVAPFDGQLGIRQVSLGQYISPGQTDIVTLESNDPIYLQFYLPEQNFSEIYAGQSIRFIVDSIPGKAFEGKITAINSKIDINTHNILVQAIVNNQQKDNHFSFVPGMFAKVEVLLSEKKNVVVLPQTAVAYTLYGDSVYIVKQEGNDSEEKPVLKVYRQFVKTGEKKGDRVVILEGVKAGEQVVNAGQMKLHNGSKILVNNTIVLNENKNLNKLGQ